MFKKKLSRQDLELRERIAKNLRKARLSIGYDQKRLAQETGYPISKISEYESGKRSPDALFIFRAADALLVSPSYFSNGIDEMSDGEFMLYGLRERANKIWDKAGEHFVQAVLKMWAHSYPLSKEVEDLIAESELLIYSLNHMIDLNQNAAWQEIRAGAKVEAQLKRFTDTTKRAKIAIHHKKNLDKNEFLQMPLFETDKENNTQ